MLRIAAHRLGVPVAWLHRAAESGDVPAIRAGRQWFVHLDGARQRLLADAERITDEGGKP